MGKPATHSFLVFVLHIDAVCDCVDHYAIVQIRSGKPAHVRSTRHSCIDARKTAIASHANSRRIDLARNASDANAIDRYPKHFHAAVACAGLLWILFRSWLDDVSGARDDRIFESMGWNTHDLWSDCVGRIAGTRSIVVEIVSQRE